MCEHLELDRWEEQAESVRSLLADHGLEPLAMEEARLDLERLEKAFQAAQAIGIPVVNIGPGGKKDVEEDFVRQTDLMADAAERAEAYGVTLCVKAHVGASIYSTPTTLRVMEKIPSARFGIDMDPSHIYRAGQDPAEALPQVLKRVRHVHIRDCLGSGPSPGEIRNQACGRGDIDLPGYFRAMVDGGYSGPVDLEVIGARDEDATMRAIIAAESYGYMNACLKALGAR
jgi:sugar phosphate isomerase/epimerase